MASIYKPGRPSIKEPPASAGEYRLINKETKKIDYVGETNNLKRRKGEHERSTKPVSSLTHDFGWKKADGRFSTESRREHERIKIMQKKPPLNLRSGGGGRITRRKRQLRKTSSVVQGAYKVEGKKRTRFKWLLDLVMIAVTGGLWLVWMFFRYLKNRKN